MATITPITTAEQLLHAPGFERCELIRGELMMMSPTGGRHGYIVVNITLPLATFVRQHGLGKVFGAETGFQIAHNPDTVRAPDVAFVSTERIGDQIPRGFFQGAPDLAVEVLSPDDRLGRVLRKVNDWLEAGCRAVWVIDPDSQSVSIHLRGQEVRILGIADQLSGGEILPGFSFPIAEILGA
jgi:Uma2 family endonuclease